MGGVEISESVDGTIGFIGFGEAGSLRKPDTSKTRTATSSSVPASRLAERLARMAFPSE